MDITTFLISVFCLVDDFMKEKRLRQASYSNGRQFEYTYDAVGNRSSQMVDLGPGEQVETTYQYDHANRLEYVDSQLYTWDYNGNLLADGTGTYAYDRANLLAGVSAPSMVASFVYNGQGDRVQQTVNNTTTTYTLDLAGGLTQVLADGTHTYLYGNGRIAQYSMWIGEEYFLGDALGSVRQLAAYSNSGSVSLAKGYQPYGEVLDSAGNTATSYGYTGEWTDNTGMVYLRARYYDPTQGRFMSKDTWGGDMNQPMSYNAWLFTYANPVNLTDPSGHGQFPCELLPPEEQEDCWIGNPPNVSGYNEKIPPAGVTFTGSNLTPPSIYKRRWIRNLSGVLCSCSGIVPPGTEQSQFISNTDPYAASWPPYEGNDDNMHTGLCGQAVIAALLNKVVPGQYSLNRVVHDFLYFRPGDPPDYTTVGELASFINTAYAMYLHADGSRMYVWDWTNNFNDPYGIDEMPDLMRPWLTQQSYFIAGVKVGGSTGKLNNGNASHWIVISGVSNEWNRTWEGNGYSYESPWRWIRIYNPFDNDTEYYTWNDFRRAWLADNAAVLKVDTRMNTPIRIPARCR
jgi:RHS repeat-associated protein